MYLKHHECEDKDLHMVFEERSMEQNYLSQLPGKKDSAKDYSTKECLSSQRMRSLPGKDSQPE